MPACHYTPRPLLDLGGAGGFHSGRIISLVGAETPQELGGQIGALVDGEGESLAKALAGEVMRAL